MATAVAEHLIILSDIGAGLLTRVYNLVTFPKPGVFGPNAELERFGKALEKRFPEFPESLNKVQGVEVFKKRATEIMSILEDYYKTFLDVLNFSEAARNLLAGLSTSITEFNYDLNSDLLGHYMNLIQRYGQLHMLMARITCPKMCTAAYARAHHISSGNTEASFSRIAKYMEQYEPDHLKKMQQDFKDISFTVGDTVATFLQPLSKWSEVKMLVSNKTFDVFDKPEHMCLPTGEKNHLELLMLEKYRQWTMWGLLLCPSELKRPAMVDMLCLCLKQHYVIELFRDQDLDIFPLYDNLFHNYRSEDGKFKLSKQKESLKTAYKDFKYTVSHHHELRTYLRVESDTLIKFFREFPACFSPKIQMVMAILSMARTEVLWYFRHLGKKPYKEPRKFEPVFDSEISKLIHNIQELKALLIENKTHVQTYYLEYLQGIDAKKMESVVGPFLKGANVQSQVTDLLNIIMNASKGATIDDNFEAVRLNWYRVSAYLNNQSSAVPAALTKTLSNVITTVVIHSRNVDCIEPQLRSCCSLGDLYWWKHLLEQQLDSDILSEAGAQSHLFSLVKCVPEAMDCVHRICPEEQTSIGSGVVNLVDAFLRKIMTGTMKIFANIFRSTLALRQQTSYESVLRRVTDPHGGVVPGTESEYENRNQANMKTLRMSKKAAGAICNACRSTRVICAYNIEFVPREYLYENISSTFRRSLRQLCVRKNHIERPSIILANIQLLIHVYRIAEQNININVSDIVRDVLLSEFHDEKAGTAGAPLNSDGGDEKEEGVGIIHTICKWFKTLFSADLGRVGIYYSPLKQSFVSRPMAGARSAGIYSNAESYTDRNELEALCTLLGPYGIRVLERNLVDIIANNVPKIFEILQTNQGILSSLRGRFAEGPSWLDAIGRISDLDKLTHYFTIIGCVQALRKLIQRAMRTVSSKRVPFIYESVSITHEHLHARFPIDPSFAAMDSLAKDVGLDVGEADHDIRAVLQKATNAGTLGKIWTLIPEAFGLCFVSAPWKAANFSSHNEGHISNLHTIPLAIHMLINGLQRTGFKTESHDTINKSIQNQLERCLRCACYTLLHLRSQQDNDRNLRFPLEHIQVMCQIFVESSNGRLSLDRLEECYPFTLLRTNYLALFEAQSASGQSFVSMDEDEKGSG